MHPPIFHTGSIAEYHDSWLRIRLSHYVSCIDGNTNDDGVLVYNDNTLISKVLFRNISIL